MESAIEMLAVGLLKYKEKVLNLPQIITSPDLQNTQSTILLF